MLIRHSCKIGSLKTSRVNIFSNFFQYQVICIVGGIVLSQTRRVKLSNAVFSLNHQMKLHTVYCFLGLGKDSRDEVEKADDSTGSGSSRTNTDLPNDS